MYMFPDMIDMGLKTDQNWPTDDHRIAAQNIAICNHNVNNCDILTAVVQSVISVPADKIRDVTYEDLREHYNCPAVKLY